MQQQHDVYAKYLNVNPIVKYALVLAYMYILAHKEHCIRAKLNASAAAKYRAKLALQEVEDAGAARCEEKSVDLEDHTILVGAEHMEQQSDSELGMTIESLKISRADEATLMNSLSSVLVAHRSNEEMVRKLKDMKKSNQKEFGELLRKFEFDDVETIVRFFFFLVVCWNC
jgi:hypothetical protein